TVATVFAQPWRRTAYPPMVSAWLKHRRPLTGDFGGGDDCLEMAGLRPSPDRTNTFELSSLHLVSRPARRAVWGRKLRPKRFESRLRASITYRDSDSMREILSTQRRPSSTSGLTAEVLRTGH